MAKEYKQTLKGLSDKLKSEPAKLPIQEVRPVDQSDNTVLFQTKKNDPVNQTKKESHLNFWVPEELMERLKIHAAVSKKSIKQIGIEALEVYLNQHR